MGTSPRALLFAGTAVLACGCHDSDVSIELTDKGTAVLASHVKISPDFVRGGRRLARISPALDILKEADPLFLRTPDDAARKDLEKAGVKVLEQSSVNTEAAMSSKFRVQLRRLSSLEAFARLRGGDAAASDVPKESGLRLPVDAVRLSRDPVGVYALEGTFPTRKLVAIQAGSVKDSEKGFAEALGVGMELANEVNEFHLTVSMTVPGEIVDFAPASAGRLEGLKGPVSKKDPARKVVFSVAMPEFTPGQMKALKGEYLPLPFKVRFRLPKGKSLPEDALWDGVPKPPAAPEPPKDPPPPPQPPKEGG